jgi:hypothetical protein
LSSRMEQRTATGSSVVEGAVSIAALYSARKYEIAALEEQITSQRASGHRRAWQLLPRHLRRRAGSHNPYRIPQRLRSLAIHQMLQSARSSGATGGAGDPTAVESDDQLLQRLSAPSTRRKSRPPRPVRRSVARGALKEFRRLATHLWHSKRFHMIDWGHFRVAWSSTNKSSRAVRRHLQSRSAAACSNANVLIHDASYTSYISLRSSSRSDLIALLEASLGVQEAKKILSSAHLEGSCIPLPTFVTGTSHPTPLATVLLQWNMDDRGGYHVLLFVPMAPSFDLVLLQLRTALQSSAVAGEIHLQTSQDHVASGLSRIEILGHPASVATVLLTSLFSIFPRPTSHHEAQGPWDVSALAVIEMLRREQSGSSRSDQQLLCPPRNSFWTPLPIWTCSIPQPEKTLKINQHFTRKMVLEERSKWARPDSASAPIPFSFPPQQRVATYRQSPLLALNCQNFGPEETLPIWIHGSVDAPLTSTGSGHNIASGITIIVPTVHARELWLSLVLSPSLRTRPVGLRDIVHDWRFEMSLHSYWLDSYPGSPCSAASDSVQEKESLSRCLGKPRSKRSPIHLRAFLDGLSRPFALLWQEITPTFSCCIPGRLSAETSGPAFSPVWIDFEHKNSPADSQTTTVLLKGARIYKKHRNTEQGLVDRRLTCSLPTHLRAEARLDVIGLVVYGAYSYRYGRASALAWVLRDDLDTDGGGRLFARNEHSPYVHSVLAYPVES